MPDKELDFWDDSGDAFREILGSWPKEVRSSIGADIRRVQRGQPPRNGKPLKEFCIAASEVRHNDGARVVYSIAFTAESGKVFIADAFMKDSGDGSEMRASDRRRIQGRLKKHKSQYQHRKKQRLH